MFTIKTLGKNGRWANTLFQYCLAKALAKKHNCELQVPADWVGRTIFKIDDPVITADLPPTPLDSIPATPDVDLFGYWQFDEAIANYSIQDARRWLSFNDQIMNVIGEFRTFQYNAYHVRSTDYVGHKSYAHLPNKVIRAAIVEQGYDLDQFVKVSDEGPCEIRIHGAEPWLSDFIVMSQAHTLFRTNSTFSLWAHILGNNKKVYAPIVEAQTGTLDKCIFTSGNWPRCTDQSNHGYGSKITDLHFRNE